MPNDLRSSRLATGSAAVAQPVLRERMPELDTIRGIAIAGVVLYHLFWISLGFCCFVRCRAVSSISRPSAGK